MATNNSADVGISEMVGWTEKDMVSPVIEHLVLNKALNPNLVPILPSSNQSFEEDTDSDEEQLQVEELLKEFCDEDDHQMSTNPGKDHTFVLRNYQKELSENALTGQNTIICSPTGSGKTFVALHIILEHLMHDNENRKKRVAFLARTVPLTMQQFRFVKKFLPSVFEIENLTGQSTTSMILHQLIEYTDILVMTPMILENHLKRGLLSNLGKFSLIIFDECHHTRREEPYNTLMFSYLKAKVEKEDIQLPQVVGLTASIGVDKAMDEESAKKNVLEVMGNLDVDTISTVEKNKDELRRVVPVPDEEMKLLTERMQDESVMKIHEVMRKLEAHAIFHAKELRDEAVLHLASQSPPSKKSQKYGQWAVSLQKAATEVPILDEQRETNISSRSLSVIAEYLMAYSVALETHDLVQLIDVMDYLDRCFENFRFNTLRTNEENTFFEYFEDLKKLVGRRYAEENPNLDLLAQTLMENLVNKGDKSRGIIFVRTRALTEAVASWLARCEVPELSSLNATPFTGANVSEQRGGMTKAQQDDIIQRFRSGNIRLLVATSVAEEGLDIPECNLVVKYNHIGNEVTTVQTRGRSRAFGGKSILLAMEEIIQREKMNCKKALLMVKAIELIREMDSDERRKYIDAYQQRIVSAWRQAEKENKKVERPFKMVCKKCRKVGVDSENLRTIYGKYRISIDTGLLDKILISPASEIDVWDDIPQIGNVVCKGEPQKGKLCYNKLGTFIKYAKTHFITVGVKNFSFSLGNGFKLQQFKQWKEMPYAIKKLEVEDIKNYLTHFKGNVPNAKKYMKSRSNEATQEKTENRPELRAGHSMGQNLPFAPSAPVSNLALMQEKNAVETTRGAVETFRKEAPKESEPDAAMFDESKYEPSLTLSMDSGRSNTGQVKKNAPSLTQSDYEMSGHRVYEPSIGSSYLGSESSGIKRKNEEENVDHYLKDGSSLTSNMSIFEAPESEKTRSLQRRATTRESVEERMQDFDDLHGENYCTKQSNIFM